jgi:hypothetical protein
MRLKVKIKKNAFQKFLFDNDMTTRDFGKDSGISQPTAYGLCGNDGYMGISTRKKLVKYFAEKGLNKEDFLEVVEIEDAE